MGEIQLWQSDTLGTDRDTLEKVLHTFKSDGVQGMASQQALESYVKKLDDSSIREICDIDGEVAVQILADCFGVCKAFKEVTRIMGYVTTETATRMGWISPAAYAEVVGKHEERTKRLENEKDALLQKYSAAAQKIETAERKRKALREEIAHYKADLYDFYAAAGKLPDYEGR